MLTVQVIDINRVHFAISELRDIDKSKVIKEGLRKATRFLVNKGRANIKVSRSGNLYKSMTNKIKRRKLGALAGFGALGRHAHLVDSGTQKRYTKKGYYRGAVKGNKFWEQTVDTNYSQALEILYDGIERAVDKIMIRNGK